MDFTQTVHQRNFLEQSARYLGFTLEALRDAGASHPDASSSGPDTWIDASQEEGA